jgi:hypothetical protein
MVATYVKPAVRNAWADTATGADIVDPGNAVVTQGWLKTSTPPARQFFNWVLNWVASGIRYFMQRGIVDWDILETYAVGGVVQTGGYVYYSLQNANTGHPPAGALGTNAWWAPLQGYATLTYLNSTFVTNTSLATTLLNYVTNTSLATTLASYATNAALALKAPILSPTFTGNPQSVTPLPGINSTSIATTAYVQTELLNRATIAALNLKANIASPVLTGVPSAPTAAAGTVSSQIATCSFVNTAITALSLLTANNGYYVFPPDGSGRNFTLEWGIVTSNGTTVGVTFPRPFSSIFGIQLAIVGATGTFSVNSYSNANFGCSNGFAGSSTFWFAYGYS